MKQLKFSFLPIPEEIMLDETLPFKAKLLFGIIAKTNLEEVKFSVGYLAKRMKCSDRYARQMIQELEKRNLITIKRVKGRASIYSVNYVIVNQQQIRSWETIKQENTPEQKFTPEVVVQDTPEAGLQGNNKDISNKDFNIFSKENIAKSETPENLKNETLEKETSKPDNGQPKSKTTYGDPEVNLIIDTYRKKFGFTPTDRKVRFVAHVIRQNIKSFIKEIAPYKKYTFEEVVEKAFDWYLRRDQIKGETLDVVRRKFKMLFEKTLKKAKEVKI